MSFDLGELEGEVSLDASKLDATIAAALDQLTRWGRDGQRTASTAGEQTGTAYSRSLGARVDLSSTEQAVRSGLADAGATADNVGRQAGDLYSRALAQGVDMGDAERQVRSGLGDAGATAGTAGRETGDEFSRGLGAATSTAEAEQRLRSGLADTETTARRAGGEAGEAFSAGAGEGGGDAGEGILGNLKSALGSGPAIVTTAGVAIGSALALAITTAIQLDTVTRRIASGLGLTVEEAGRYGKLAGELYSANYGESMEEVGDAIVAVRKNFTSLGNVSDGVLKSIVGQVISMGGRFEEEFSAISRTADQLFKTGLAKNGQEALDILAAGFQSGVNAADDLLDTFDEYSTVFRQLGLSGQDALGLLSQGLKAGSRDADVVADAFKEMLLIFQGGDSRSAIEGLGLNFDALTVSMSKGGESAKAATDLIVDGVNAIQDPATKAATAVEVFGTKAEDLQGALSGLDVSGAATEFEDAYGRITGSSTELDATLGGGLSATIATVGRNLSGFGQSIANDLEPYLNIAAQAAGILFGILESGYDVLTGLPGQVYVLGAAVAVWASWGTIAAGGRALAAAISAIALSAKGALVSLGPVGLAIIAVGTAMSFLADNGDDLASQTDGVRDAFDQLKGTLDQQTGAYTKATSEMLKQQAVSSGLSKTLSDAGISLDLYAAASLGSADAQNELAEKVAAAQREASGAAKVYDQYAETLSGAGYNQQQFVDAVNGGDLTKVITDVQEYTDGLERNGGAIGSAAQLQNEFSLAIAQAGGPITTLDDALVLVGDTSKNLAQAQQDVIATTGGVGESASAAYDRVLAYSTATGASADEVQRMGKEAGLTQTAIDAITAATESATEAADPFVEQLEAGASNADQMASSISDLQLALDILTGGQVDAAEAARNYDAQVRAVTAAHRAEAQAQADLETASANLTTAQENLGKSMEEGGTTAADVAQAQRDLEDAQDGVKDSADQTAGELDNLAKKSQEMTARAFEGAGGMANYEDAVKAARDEMGRQRQAFIDSAKAAGVGEVAAEQLADAQGLIPGNVDTAYNALRVQDAKNAAGQVKGAVDDVPGQKTIRFDVEGNAIETIGGIERRVSALTGKTIYINTVEQTTRAATNAQGVVANYAEGGRIRGNGAPGYHVPAMVGIDEHMLDLDDVDAFHGHANIYGFRDVLERSGMGAAGQYLVNLAGRLSSDQAPASPTRTAVPAGGSAGGSGALAGRDLIVNQVGGDILGGIDRAAQLARAGRYS